MADGGRLIDHAAACERARSWLTPDPDGWADHRSLLALEPLRYVLTALPLWTAWEQVPGVLPL